MNTSFVSGVSKQAVRQKLKENCINTSKTHLGIDLCREEKWLRFTQNLTKMT
jgi:hypothetical protein